MKEKKKRALMITIAVALYIMSPVSMILGSHLSGEITITIFFTEIALATSILIYSEMTKSKYYATSAKRADDTIIEEIKEKNYIGSRNRAILRSVSAIAWTLGILFFFFVDANLLIFILCWAVIRLLKSFMELGEVK
ncbi:MAG: hypothetical protein LBN09_06225 [Clostridioides sp.]|jgi:hypothetical protein|nr:hypothetical protein [Clostridioides sp.]